MDNLVVLFFEKLSYCFPQWWNQFIVPSTVHRCSLFSTSSPTLVIFCFSDNTIPTSMCVCEVISHCGFHLYFLVEWFSCICWFFVCLLWKNVYVDPLLIFNCSFFFSTELCEFLYILEIAFSQLHKGRPAMENLLFIFSRALAEVYKCLKCSRLCTFCHSIEWSQLYMCACARPVETQGYCLQGCVWGIGYVGEGFMNCWQHAYASLGESTSSYQVYGWASCWSSWGS